MPCLCNTLIDGREKSPIILVEDTVNQSGKGLLNCFVANLSSRCDHTHIILYEHFMSNVLDLQSSISTRVTFHNGISNPLHIEEIGLKQDTSITLDTDLVQHISSFLRHSPSEKKVAIVIDDLSNLILEKGGVHVCRQLHRLSQLVVGSSEVVQVVALLHSDLHDDSTLHKLQHVSHSRLSVAPALHTDYHLSCSALHKRASGKVLQTHEQVKFSDAWELVACSEVTSLPPIEPPTQDQTDPAANLTFNLTLSEKEKSDRNNLVLPYLKQPRKDIDSGAGGKIFYQPDDADDFDEEDPDDDLDI